MDFLAHHPLGTHIPNSVHAVCASLPTMADVIGYEEKDPRIMEKLDLGYPRFIQHFYLRRVLDHLRRRKGWDGDTVFLAASEGAARRLLAHARPRDASLDPQEGFVAVRFSEDPEAASRARLFLQHTGCGISSREAEDVLLREGLLASRQEEETVSGDAAAACVSALRAASGAAADEDVFLCRSGMNAFHAVFLALQRAQAARGRNLWLQVGWLYLDTQRILEKFTDESSSFLWIHDPLDQRAIEEVFAQHGARLAGVVTETPTNPLVRTGDIPRLAELSRKHGAALVLDPSLMGLANADAFPHADALVVSLTKYASSRGDVMAGLAVANRTSPFAEVLSRGLKEFVEPLSLRDAARLAWTLRDMEDVSRAGSANTERLVAWLERHPAVARVHWAGASDTRRNHETFMRGKGCFGAMLSVELKRPLAEVYDRLRCVKAPSFGARFTMACPFVYLTHYDRVRDEAGRRWLRARGLEPELLRISPGVEPFDRIRDAFEEALS
ncbi:MAG: PLP-dependent transferase [Verrucomicrobiae bacterium]|nr:PLP-dependent transferase [Verrucomicrobiae bacterium]